MTLTRRNFLKRTAVSTAALSIPGMVSPSLMGLSLTSKNLSFGFQVWTIREQLVNDFAGTLKMMADLGYKEVEMCSPLGYSNAGFKPLRKYTGKELGQIVADNGLTCTSSHFNMGELRDHLEDRIEWAQGVGMQQMIASSFWLPDDATVDDYRRAADELNGFAEKTKKAGLQMGFHNHHMEFEKRGDELIYNALLDEFDPDLVKMQFQVAVVDIGYHAADYFRKYPGRFISAHLADYSHEKKSQVPVGDGIVDWDVFFDAAQTSGVKNYYVEMNPEYFAPSAAFLSKV